MLTGAYHAPPPWLTPHPLDYVITGTNAGSMYEHPMCLMNRADLTARDSRIPNAAFEWRSEIKGDNDSGMVAWTSSARDDVLCVLDQIDVPAVRRVDDAEVGLDSEDARALRLSH